jgi:hypothetical protein
LHFGLNKELVEVILILSFLQYLCINQSQIFSYSLLLIFKQLLIRLISIF